MVSYHVEDTRFSFTGKIANNKWLKMVAESEHKKLKEISIIFCSDPYLLEINRQYLQHDYYTDIITFDYCEDPYISGDLFISVDTVRANAQTYKTLFEEELNRVMVHGVLHLCGYDDHTKEQQKTMRAKEDYYLKLRILAS